MVMGEPARILVFAEERPGNAKLSILVVLGGSLMAFTYNFVSFKFLALTSSVTHTICGNVTLFAVVIVPALFIDHIVSVLSWVGFSIFIVSSGAYSYVSWRESKQAQGKAAQTQPQSEAKGPAAAEGGKAPTEVTPLKGSRR